MALAIVAMATMIIALDQVLWRPVVVWAERFRVEEGGQEAPSRSWVLDLLRRSRALAAVSSAIGDAAARRTVRRRPREGPRAVARVGALLSTVLYVALVLALAFAGWQLARILRGVPAMAWLRLGGAGAVTLGRVLLSTALGTAWALPAGLAIGLSPRWLRVLQPVVQVVASFPAPMLFPLVIALMATAGVSLGIGSVVLMLLGTQWYILFNVIAGAAAMPADLREAAQSYRVRGLGRFRALHFPAIFPQLITGWVTAAGGAWNASIVAEYVTVHGRSIATWGLGAHISEAAARADFPMLAASIVWMAAIVVVFNRVVWRRLHRIAETRFSLSK
jgi:NitT/TauT family transport system permease protein